MNLKEIEMPELYKLNGYLAAVSDFIKTGELRWDFEVSLYEYESPSLGVVELVKAAYPKSQPEKAEITECSLEDILETFKHELGRCLPLMETQRILQPILGLYAGMWQYLNECIDYSRSRFFEYFASDEPDSLSGGILGEFAFIICNENLHRCLIFIGVTVD